MYVDSYECTDDIAYQKAFIKRQRDYKKCFFIYNNDGNVMSTPVSFPVPEVSQFHLILVTHNNLTFYENDYRKTKWTHKSKKATTEKKGKGQSLLDSDFLMVEQGQLKDGNE